MCRLNNGCLLLGDNQNDALSDLTIGCAREFIPINTRPNNQISEEIYGFFFMLKETFN